MSATLHRGPERGHDRRDQERRRERGATARAHVRCVPAGWAPGTGILVGAWCVGAVIARLTGAPAVILVLGATAVALGLEVIAGWWRCRRLPTPHIELARLTTVGEPTRIHIAFIGRGRADDRRDREPRTVHVVVRDPRDDCGAAAVVADEPVVEADGRRDLFHATFASAGRVEHLVVEVEAFGPAGLVAWRRRSVVGELDVLVAPVADGSPLDVDRSPTMSIGTTAAIVGRNVGDVDGIRPWRRGDDIAAVHWPTSLRADELVVHDRTPVSDERWRLDLTDSGLDPGRVRATLDEGLRLGHRVSATMPGAGSGHGAASAGTTPPTASLGTVTSDVEVIDVDDAAAVAAAYAAAEAARTSAAAAEHRDGALVRLGAFLRRPRRLTATEPSDVASSARWAAAGAAIATAGLLVGALDSPPFVLPLVAAAIALGAVVSIRLAHNADGRPLWMRVAIALTLIGALGLIVADATDVDSLLAALRGPMPNMLLLLVVLHGFEILDRRTLRAHLAITLVVSAYAAGLRIDAALGPWLVTWGTAFATALLLTGRTTRPRRESHESDALARTPDRRRRSTLSSTARGVAWIAAGVGATIAVLAVVPVPDGPARLGLPALSVDARSAAAPGSLVGADGTPVETLDDIRSPRDAVTGYPGFTETLDTSIRGTLGDETVMRVRSPEPAFWRGQTFAEFDGRTWHVDEHTGMPQEGPLIDVAPAIGDAPSSPIASRELIQTYYVEHDLPNVVFAASRPTRLIFDGTVWTRPDGALRSDVTLTAGSVYTVLSQRLQVDAATLRSQGDLGALFDQYRAATGDESIDQFLQLPRSTTQRTVDLATELRITGEPTYDTIERYQAWIAANVEYDLDAPVPADDADAVDDFLFESRRGFCEQIASALTIMLRSQGVPARLATGYVSGERDRVSGVWNVRASDAHAWVEVWFPQTGWQAFDPTASVPLAADATRGTVGGDVASAAVGWLVDHRVGLVTLALVALAGWATAGAVGRLLHRHRRGRWGLLQDRFMALGPPDALTNPTRAAVFTDELGDELGDEADSVADALDRAAFDPTWVDDDAEYQRARSAVATLERAARR